jgi:hypothetical protein
MKRLMHITGLALILNCAQASPEITAGLSTNTIHVGDRVTLTLTVDHADDERLVMPSLNREPFIVVWDTQTKPSEATDGRKTTTAQIAFSSFIIGEHRIATNALILLGPESRETSLPFPELTINVTSILTNPPPSLADIKPPVDLPGFRWLRIVWMILAIAALAIIAALLIRYFMRRQKAPPTIKVIPPHEIALTALNALRHRGFIERGEAEPFYVELSAIIRIYLEDRFNLRAPEQTTEEFIRTSSQSNVLSLEHRQLTQDFLEQSDLVKFARFEPSSEDMIRAWDAGAKLVRETVEARAS